jgi:hypothetical protein
VQCVAVQEDVLPTPRRRAAANAELALLSSVVGLQFRSLEHLQGARLPAMADAGLLKVKAARECDARRETPVSAPAHVHFRQTCCCGSDFHQSRSLQSIPFRDGRPLKV